ncbi:uncharacterized protein LOC143370380 [Andrena cerasifolii]|uniref:uncharacterized protein LOC143366634 n=1 Tax=Andrena cerasifolii TaxID=2819439 RepID=UPI004037F980
MFKGCSVRTKKRRTESLRNEYTVEELTFATEMKLRAEGKASICKILDFLLENPDRIKDVEDFCKNINKNKNIKSREISKEKGLSLFITTNLSKRQYNLLRETGLKEGTNIYPSYYKIKQAKEDCYPPINFISVDEQMAKINIQALLDHTSSRILKVLQEQTPTLELSNKQLVLITKWGCDGASGQSQYKQKIISGQDFDDSSVFIASIVPLKLVNDENGDVLWQNNTPSSTRFCRPIFFQFIKESAEVISNIVQEIQKEIGLLQITNLNNAIGVKHHLIMTMVDGKVCSTISATSSMRCYICEAKPTEMNCLEKVVCKPIKEDLLNFGMSSLHAWIRCMECLLHIAYRLDFKTWSASTPQRKILMKEKKDEIQKEFRNRLGLIVDMVKQGYGTSNDGNTARRFFENPEITAQITGLNEDLIKKFSILLQAIASGLEINKQKFGEFAMNLARQYVELYGWYYMPPTVHKILIHGQAIIAHAILPIGQLTEEAQEARNKDFRHYRELHARKSSRKLTNQDVLNNLLISSDPYISTSRLPLIRTERRKQMWAETLALLDDSDT